MKIRVDRTLCAGHAVCALKGGKLFPLDDDGFSIANGTIVPPGEEHRARLGASACPERAITLEDETSDGMMDRD